MPRAATCGVYPQQDMLPPIMGKFKKTTGSWLLLLLGALVAAPAITEAGVQIQIPVGKCVDPRGCGPTTGAGAAGPDARVEAERAAREQESLGKDAFDKGVAAFARGNFKSAATFFLTATRHQPNNVAYRKERARALRALSEQNGNLLVELRGAGAEEFDATGVKPELRALLKITEPGFSDAVAKSFGIAVDLNDPANVRVKIALSQLEDRLKYDRAAKLSEGQIPPDPAGLEKTVAALNEVVKSVRPPDATPITAEEAETVYNRYQLNLKVKK